MAETWRIQSTCSTLAWLMILALACPTTACGVARGATPLAPLHDRFDAANDSPVAGRDELPDFQRHISPLLGRLGCNGRACHGSFQGQGGFTLSLFGYDFVADYQALTQADSGRVDPQAVASSLILSKPTSDDDHGGGQRFEPGSWPYRVLSRWIEAGAPFEADRLEQLDRLEVVPAVVALEQAEQAQPLTVIAHWADGTSEDVTCLCRFASNDPAIADVTQAGVVTSTAAGDTHVVVSYDNAVVPVQVYRPVSDLSGDRYPSLAVSTDIDRLVLEKLKLLGILPSAVCDDETFLRRVSLDLSGTLPTAAEVREFLADGSSDKRRRKIDELLQRPGYAAWWTTFLCDLTGNNESQLNNYLPPGVAVGNQWYQWLYRRVADNLPYDQIVEGIVTASSRDQDESYLDYCEQLSEVCRDASGRAYAERPGLVHYWARRNFRTPEDRAIGFAYTFLGVRIHCAQCHKHPFDQWSKDDFENFQQLFAGVVANQNSLDSDGRRASSVMMAELGIESSLKGNELRKQLGQKLRAGEVIPFPELVVRTNPPQRGAADSKRPAKNSPPVAKARLLGGPWIEWDNQDVRPLLMRWLRDDNPLFAKAFVNRVWAHYFGIGIVHPADDLSLANAPSNAPLLDYLARGFKDSGYDMHWLHREILNSDTYQRCWRANETNLADERNFSRARLRRLPAEPSYDAIHMALSNDQIGGQIVQATAPRAVTHGSTGGRPNGNREPFAHALQVFGRSARESNCDCDRSNDPNLLQTIYIANDQQVQQWLSDPNTSWSAQVARQFGWSSGSAGSSSTASAEDQKLERLVANYRQQIQLIESRLAQAEQQQRREAIQKLQQQKEQQLRRLQRAARSLGSAEQLSRLLDDPSDLDGMAELPIGISPDQAQWIVDNAYLRTLSRHPRADELAKASAFLTREVDSTAAVQDLLWSLINSTEFILNH